MTHMRSRWQTTIIGATLVAVAVCMLLAWRSNATTEYRTILQSTTLPENDGPLLEWLKGNDNISDVAVTRIPEGVGIDYVNANGDYELPQLPLPELGYSSVTAVKTRMMKPSFAGAPLFLCYGCLALVFVLMGAVASSFLNRLQSSECVAAAAKDA